MQTFFHDTIFDEVFNKEFAPAKLPKVKFSGKYSSFTSEQKRTDYYLHKPVEVTDIQFPSHIVDEDKYSDYLYDLTQHLGSFVKNFEVEADESLVKITKTGFDCEMMGLKMQEFEWCNKSSMNSLSAIFNRQLSSHLDVDPLQYRKFMNMTKRFWDWFFKGLDADCIFQKFSFATWIDSKTEWTAEKRKKYYKTYLGQKHGKVNKFVGSFKTMVKSGETYFSNLLEQDSKGFTINQESRPRNI